MKKHKNCNLFNVNVVVQNKLKCKRYFYGWQRYIQTQCIHKYLKKKKTNNILTKFILPEWQYIGNKLDGKKEG